jgi:hypothetical protein
MSMVEDASIEMIVLHFESVAREVLCWCGGFALSNSDASAGRPAALQAELC